MARAYNTSLSSNVELSGGFQTGLEDCDDPDGGTGEGSEWFGDAENA
jgi:hypothetical protein